MSNSLKFRKIYLPIILILLLHFAIRAHNITHQVPHIDEGFHVSRAIQVWSFEQNPGRFMHGKLLIYYWLGIFDLHPVTSLHIARTALALFTLITPATLYLLGKQFRGHGIGLLAATIYALMPFAVFFERLAMVDPFANAFATLLAWRSIIFAKRPTKREGVVLGVLITLTLMAKLTMGLMPFLPVLAGLVYYQWSTSNWKEEFRQWVKTYFPPLLISASIVVLAWLPILIPALIASLSDDPFTLLSQNNLQQVQSTSPLTEVQQLLPQIYRMTSASFLFIIILASSYLLVRPVSKRMALYVIGWGLLMGVFPLIFANQPRPRYFMPLVSPAAFIVAYAAVEIWQSDLVVPIFQHSKRIIISGILTVWIVGFAIPFDHTASRSPTDLDLGGRQTMLYLIGTESGIPIEQAVRIIEASNPPPMSIYAAWGTCQVLYFYTEVPVHCMNRVQTSREIMQQDASYVVINNESGFSPWELQSITWNLLARLPRPEIGTVIEAWQAINQDRSASNTP